MFFHRNKNLHETPGRVSGSNPFIYLLLVVFLMACNQVQYSVYDATVPEKKENVTHENIYKIQALQYHRNFKFAVIADIHLNYDNLKACIDTINKQKDLEFVIVAGDFTDKGLLEEYQLMYNFFSSLKIPYLTVIGNHDLGLQYGNGRTIYREFFGDLNYSAIINDRKFIFFDSNIDLPGDKTLDFNWLHKQLADTSVTNEFFLVSHQDPWSPNYNGHDSLKYNYQQAIRDPHIIYSIFGHEHYFFNNESSKYVIVDALRLRRHYCIVTVNDSKATVEQVSF
jgi:3',5'-cyclic-AMP phosphodiesterase